MVDAGWKADTLLALFQYDFEQAYRPIGVKYCHSCGTRNYGIRVQPFWRHLLERVRLGIGTDMSSEIGPKAGGTLDNNTNRSLKVQGTITKENSPYYDHDEVLETGWKSCLATCHLVAKYNMLSKRIPRESQVDSVAGMKGMRRCA